MSQIKRNRLEYPFPVVSFWGSKKDGVVFAYFNRLAKPLFTGHPRIDVFKTPQHLIFATDGKVGAGSICVRHKGNGIELYCAEFSHMPVIGRTYKLYRCAQGYAIRIYDPVFERRKEDGKSL